MSQQEAKERITINLNESVQFVLNNVGARIWMEYDKEYDQYDHLRRGKECKLPTSMQLYNFMEIFGPHCNIGEELPVVGGNIYFEVKKS